MLRPIAALVAVALAIGLLGTVAFGQSDLAASDPPAGAIVRTLPTAVRLDLTPELGSNQLTVHVTGPDRRHYESALPRAEPASSGVSRFVVPLASGAGQGWYTVEWTVADPAGTTLRQGRFDFGYSPAGSLFEPPPGARGESAAGIAVGGEHDQHGAGAASSGTSAGVSWWPIPLLAIALIAVALGLLIYRHRSRRSPPAPPPEALGPR